MLVHEQNIIKLADFGLSRRIVEVSSNNDILGMIPYIDPQLLKKQMNDKKKYKANKKSDVYSVGVLLWEISSGQIPFKSYSEHYQRLALMSEITDGKREIPISSTPVDYINIYTSKLLYYIILIISFVLIYLILLLTFIFNFHKYFSRMLAK